MALASPVSFDQQRMRDLVRMRRIATGLLVLMVVLFVLASLWAPTYPWLYWVRAFAEAGTVGACADWFAVTALFRQPLGLPIPHTGLIPRNKDRIGDAFGHFIAENFLTESVLDDRLRAFEVSNWGAVYLKEPAQVKALAKRLADLVPEVTAALPPNLVREIVGAGALAAAKAVPAAPAAARVLSIAWNHGRSQVVLDWLVERLHAMLKRHEDVVVGRVENQTASWMPKFVDRLIAGKILAGLYELVEEMRAPDHPWRQELGEAIEAFIVRLKTDRLLRVQAERIKRQVLRDPRFLEQVNELWSQVVETVTSADRGALESRIEQGLLLVGGWLEKNDTVRERLNAWARALVSRLIAPRRHHIGRFVAEIVAGWDSRNVVDKLELQFGPDLQYIRINGTLIGGLVGVALYALTLATGL